MDFVEKFLLNSGIYPTTRGYDYFIMAVHEAESGEKKMTKIYKKIAEKYGTNPLCVERAIRLINTKINDSAIQRYMNNSEVIFTLARYKTLSVGN